ILRGVRKQPGCHSGTLRCRACRATRLPTPLRRLSPARTWKATAIPPSPTRRPTPRRRRSCPALDPCFLLSEHGGGFLPPSGVRAMRRIVCLLAGVLLVVPSLGSDAPKEYDGATERDELEGTWELVGIECRPVQEGPSNQCVVTFRGGRFTKSYGD